MDTFLPSCPNADWGLLEQRQPIRLHGHCTHGGHLTEKAGGGARAELLCEEERCKRVPVFYLGGSEAGLLVSLVRAAGEQRSAKAVKE